MFVTCDQEILFTFSNDFEINKLVRKVDEAFKMFQLKKCKSDLLDYKIKRNLIILLEVKKCEHFKCPWTVAKINQSYINSTHRFGSLTSCSSNEIPLLFSCKLYIEYLLHNTNIIAQKFNII